MNSIALTKSSRLFLGLWLASALAVTGLSDERNQAQRLSVFSQVEKTAYDKKDVSLLRLKSGQACNVKFNWVSGDTAAITWTIEGFSASSTPPGQPVNSPLKVITSRDSRAVTVRVDAETNLQRKDDHPSVGVSLVDANTGISWQVRIEVRLPRGIDIDTSQFEGYTQFAHEPALGDDQRAPGSAPDAEDGDRALKSAQELKRQQNEAEALRKYQELLRNRKNRR